MPKLTTNQLMYHLRSYTTEIIVLGGPLESNTARGEAECCISLSTPPSRNNFRSSLATVHLLVGKYGSTSYIGMDRKKNGGQ